MNNGVYVNIAGQVSALTDPEAVRVADILTKYEPKLKGREYGGLYGAVSMMLAVEGLKRAGRGLTREKFGLNAVRLMRAEKGKLVGLTGWQIFPPLY